MKSLTSLSIIFVLILSFIRMIISTPVGGEYLGTFKYTNYTIEDIKNFEVITCKDDSDCPDYSNGCELYTRYDKDVEFRMCEMTFICHKNDTCLALHNPQTYYINVKGMEYGITFVSNTTLEHEEIENQDKLILHSCDKTMIKHNLCETDTCLSSSNCYSNHCVNKTCMTNKSDPSYICRVDWKEDDEKPEMKCKYANGEKCSNNDDCDQINVCDDRYSVCASPLIAENNGDHKFPDYLFFFGVAITVVIVLSLVALVTLFVMSCIYVAMDELKNILFNISDDYRQLENNTSN